jgi:hypothetical protein
MVKSNPLPPVSHYNANYGNFQTELYAQIRREAFGDDIGQNSWLTSDEQDKFLDWLGLSPGKTLLDGQSFERMNLEGQIREATCLLPQ